MLKVPSDKQPTAKQTSVTVEQWRDEHIDKRDLSRRSANKLLMILARSSNELSSVGA